MIRRILHLPIAWRLPLMALLMAGLIALMGGLLYLRAYRTTIETIRNTIGYVAKDEAARVAVWYETIAREIVLIAAEPSTAADIRLFGEAIQADGSGMSRAQDHYARNNPHELGKRDLLVDAGDGSAYSNMHLGIHPRFTGMRQLLGFYDMFLFDPQGDLLYTVVKEADFGENFRTGPYADTGLGIVFRMAVEAGPGEVVVADFESYSPSAGAPAAFAATPVLDQAGTLIGVLAAQLSVEGLSASLARSALLGSKGDMYLVGDDGRARTRSRFDGRFVEFDPLPDLPFVSDLKAGKTGVTFGTLGVSGAESIVLTQPLDVAFGNWTLVVELDQTEHLAGVVAFRNWVLGFVGFGLVVGLALGLGASRGITRPLSSVLRSIDQVAGGDYAAEIPVADRRDEIGRLGRSVMEFRDKLAAGEALEAKRARDWGAQETVTRKMTAALESLAAGDLTCTLEDRFPYGFEPMRANFNKTLITLREMLVVVVQNADEMHTRAEVISEATEDLSKRTENQAATLEQTAAALDELTASVRSAADGAAEVETVVRNARDEATANGKVVRDAVDAMAEIKRSSDGISQIIGVIDDIAFQTNLLALNAGVEAARAGEAGRGFAVVASEVRALALRSSDAAKQIKQLVSDSSVQVHSGVALVNQAGKALAGILEHVGSIAELVSSIAVGAREQSAGLGEINVGVTELDKVTQKNTAMVDEASAATAALKQTARDLQAQVARFKLANTAGPAENPTIRGSEHRTSDSNLAAA
ncbi:methyl-accepting chemotaxis protein [Rhodobacter sp. Har01]|uniref:methyl-accepting chemotaxis protein n=1 Tax=Rhodobacter sp. Har01 TaxID=2883999 RepID=UPI001D0878F2|nr:methyl-accepting chemotaxis protein [Rhodobacter sp. Har01]MCB6180182.1 methyl-accepting chemotaxis protein [Rhodobacter sp. Har01]